MSTSPTDCTLIRVLVVSEIRLYREGLVHALEREAGIHVVSAAPTELAVTLAGVAPHIILTDSTIARSAMLVAQAADAHARVVAFGVAEDDEAEVLDCAAAGVRGFIGRDATLEDLLAAVRAAAHGDFPCSSRIAGMLVRCVVGRQLPFVRRADEARLTPREEEIVLLIDEGLSNKEIARRLRIRAATVKNHVHHLLEKLHVHRRGEAAAVIRSVSRSFDPSRSPQARQTVRTDD